MVLRFCDKNKALVKQYIQNNRRLPSGKDLELDTAGACKNDKPFVAPAARYVLKEGKVSWFVVDTTSNRVVIITRTNGAKIMVKPGTTEQDVEVKDAGWTWGNDRAGSAPGREKARLAKWPQEWCFLMTRGGFDFKNCKASISGSHTLFGHVE